MPSFCMVVDCSKNSTRNSDLSFFRVPSERNRRGKINSLAQERRQKWIDALKRDDITESKLKHDRICSLHFHSGKPADLWDTENPDWVPSKNMGYNTIRSVKDNKRYKRSKLRSERIKSKSPPRTSSLTVPEPELQNNNEEPEEQSIEQLQLALKTANEMIYKLQEENRKFRLDLDYFQNNDKDVLFYTGLPEYKYCKFVFETIDPYLNDQSSLSKFQQFILTMMKLRLNLSFTDLGHRFQVHRSTAARIFEKVLNILYSRLKSLIFWPDREYIQMNMPQSFINIFGKKTTVIIDCFEIFIEKPSNLEASAKTFSHYKHHHTIKLLIGISPQGAIIYISNAYGGRASDKYITENCGFLNNLKRGDLVLADRGFTVDHSVNLYCAEIKYPPFLKGKKQLAAKEIEDTRKLASIRIHVERVIGVLRSKFKILKSEFPITSLKKTEKEFSVVDKIVVTCCALVNLCPSIVPLD